MTVTAIQTSLSAEKVNIPLAIQAFHGWLEVYLGGYPKLKHRKRQILIL